MFRAVIIACVFCVYVVTPLFAAPPTDGLLFYQDFDHGGRALCGRGWAYEQSIPPERLVPGRFGRACRFERPRSNLLSLNQASVEDGTAGFVAGDGVKLVDVDTDTVFGRKALRAEVPAGGVVWSTEPVAVQVKAPYRPAKVFLFSVYLRSPQPGVKVRLVLADRNEDGDWRAEIEAANKKAGKDDPKAVKPPVETVSTAAVATLDATWRRVCARLEVDARREEQVLVGTLEAVGGTPATILVDGLQLEQASVYPLKNTDPTSWIPGGARRWPSWIDLPVRETGFTGERGTLGCWVRPLPDQCGGTRDVHAVLTIGTGWFAPVWQIGGGRWYVGEGPTKQPQGKLNGTGAVKALFDPGQREDWHALCLAWDEQEAVGYLDGKPFDKTPLVPGEPVHGTLLRLGGSFLENTPMTGDLDEVFLYDRRLDQAEIAALAVAEEPLKSKLPGILLRRPKRLVFLRSEREAQIPMEPVPYGEPLAGVSVTASVPDLNAKTTQTVPPGKSASLVVRPWLQTPGRSPLAAQATSGKSEVSASDVVEVFEEPAGREFIIYAWGGTDTDLEERGFNCLFGEPRGLLERGLWANARIDVREGVPHPWSPQTRMRAEAAAERVARRAMAYPNVRACLVNSECSHPPFPAEEKWFLDWMRRETGLKTIPSEVVDRPLRAAPQTGVDVPPLLSEQYPPYRFLRWWTKRGQGYYLLNNQIARWMRQKGLQTHHYSDQPETATQFEAMDLIDFWGYPKCPDGLVASFSRASCFARLAGKPFQAMPGTIYWDDGNGLWLVDDDGKRKVLCLSPDCLKEYMWISVACATSSIGMYGIGERHTQIYDKACDTAMTEGYRLIQPIGVLVGGLPEEQARVAFLETDGLYFIQPGVRDQWMRHWLTRNVGRCLARARLPFDWITDDHVYAGWLKHYDAVVVPGAWCLPEWTHRELAAYAAAGGQVIADEVMRAEMPGMVRLKIKTQSYPDETLAQELGDWAKTFEQKRQRWARVTPAKDVFTYTREAGPARYVFVINDRRECGPQYDKWKVTLNAITRRPNEPLRDKGLPQDVRVGIPSGFAVYDVLAHRRIEGKSNSTGQDFAVHLEPGSAAVLAAFPKSIERVTLRCPAKLATGTEAAIELEVLDAKDQPIPGRQLAEIHVTRPDGQPWAGVARYRRIVDGHVSVPLRLPLSAEHGTWHVEATEWISGMRTVRQFAVEEGPFPHD